MPYLVLEDFRLGQDGRKSKLTLPPGSLVKLTNGYVNRGGEVKKRKAFTSKFTLPAGETEGLARAGNALYVFGTDGEYASTTFSITAGTSDPGVDQVTGITVNGVEILGTAVDWVTSHDATAEAVAAQINLQSSSPNYSATSSGAVVTVTSLDLSTTPNGYVTVVSVGGTVTASSPANLSGGLDIPTLPVGVSYIRMLHPSGQALSSVLSYDIYDGKVYSVGLYADASIYHFYDGVEVEDWADGRARGSFTISGGSADAGTAATTQFEITGGSASAGVNMVTSVVINGVEVLGATVDWATSNSATATAVAAQIASYSSSPNWTAAAVGTLVTVTYPSVGTTANGDAASVSVAGDVTTTTPPAVSGGVDASAVTSVTVNGVEVLGSTVAFGATAAATASAIAAQIDSYSSSPEYTGTAQGSTVFVLATAGAETTPNGYAVAVTTTGNATVSGETAFSGGAAAADTFLPGESVRTFDSKVYSTSESRLHFSGVFQPTKYTDDIIGAGFISMSATAAGSEELVGVEAFYNYMAIFAKQAVQIWSIFADDEQNTKAQVIKNTGTFARNSIISFGNGDVPYLSESGIKSLTARDSTNVATITEIGDPIDNEVIAQMASITATVKESAIAVVEPEDNQLWMIVGNKVFVYSYFKSSKIAAWSVYEPGFVIEHAVVIGTKLYLRSGDTIYLYGGDNGTDYGSDYEVVVELPFVSARSIATFKEWSALDVACSGVWTIEATLDVKQPDTYQTLAIISGPTYSDLASSMAANASNIGLRFRHQAEGDATLSNAAFHYDLNEAT